MAAWAVVVLFVPPVVEEWTCGEAASLIHGVGGLNRLSRPFLSLHVESVLSRESERGRRA